MRTFGSFGIQPHFGPLCAQWRNRDDAKFGGLRGFDRPGRGMIVLHARPSPGFRDAVDAIFGPGVIVHVDEAEPLDAVAGEITALLHVLTPVTGEFIASAPKLKPISKVGLGVNTHAG